MALSQYDQSVRDAGYKYIPQSQYLLNPFQVPAGSENEVPTGIATTYQAQNMGGGGGGFNPYNPDMSQIRTDFRPDYDFRAYQDFGVTNPDQLTTAQRKEMDMNQEYYYDRPSAMQQKIGGLMNFIPGIGTLKRGAEFIGGFLKDKLPINQRAILENQLRGQGVLTDDIGRIVAAPGQYNTPEGIMAGYNAAMMNEGTFDKRTANIRETLKDKYDLSDTQIDQLISGELDEDDFTGSKYQLPSGKVTNLFSNIRNIELAKQNFIRQKNKAAEIAAFKEKQRQQKALEKQRAKTREADAAAGAFSNQVQQDSGGGGGWQQQTAAKERQGVSVAGPGFGKGAYFMDGGLVDLVDIYD